MDTKEKFIFPLWKTKSNGYLPVISRKEDKKIFETNDLTWADLCFDESDFLERKMNHAYQFRTNIEKLYQATLEAIQSRKVNGGSTSCIPVVPKTPIPPRRKMGIRKSKKPRVSCLAVRRSTRNRKSFVSAIKDFKRSVNDVPVIDFTSDSSPHLNNHTVSNEAAMESDLPSHEILSKTDVELKPVDTHQQETAQLQKENNSVLLPSESRSTDEPTIAKSTVSSSDCEAIIDAPVVSTPTEVLPKQSLPTKKAQKRRNTKTKARQRTVRRTRQASRFSTGRKSSSQSSVLTQDSLEESNEDAVDNHEPISTAISEVSQTQESTSAENKNSDDHGVEEEPMCADEVASAAVQPSTENICKKLSIELCRLSDEQIATATETSADNASLPDEPEKEIRDNSEERICLFLSDSSTVDELDVVPEIPTISGNRESKRVSRKRSHALLDGLAAKRRSIRKSIHASAKQQKQLSAIVDLSDESTHKMDSSCDEPKSKRPKPRIAKPVIKKNVRNKKSFVSSGKKITSVTRIVPKSATPVRTRSKFVSSLLHTPSSAKMNSAVKSFLVRNTPEKVNQEAVMEAKKKLLEEKQKQGEERQRKLEEQKKQRLAEEKRKREERIQRANKIREKREKEEKERQDQLQGKWEERIAVAGRAKELKKIETTAKVTREMEKIAKAEAKRREEEEEKRKRLLEQKQEREKRLLQQQTEKRLLEEQRLRENDEVPERKRKASTQIEEEQRKAEEERLKEEKMRLLAQQEEERIKKAVAAALKKQEEEAKYKEKMEKMKKNAEQKREETRKRNLEKKRQEKQRKLEEKKVREEKLRLEREKAEAEREEMLRIRKEEAEKQKLLQLAKEREARKLEAAKKKEEIRKRVEERRRLQEEKFREAEEQRKRIEKEQQYLQKIEEAKRKLQILNEEKAASSKTANISTLDSTYVKDDSVVNYDMTPRGPNKPLIPSTAENYNIDDFCSDDSTDDESRPKKVVPKWAKGALLHTAIFQQCTYPPDLDKIFPRALNTVDLASMFKVRKERYFKRTSSAIWNSPIMPPSHISFSEHCKGF